MADSGEPTGRLTPAERAQRKRDEKLADLQEQIQSGRLVVRQLTDEEKAAFDARRAKRGDAPPRRRRRP
jgi:hypothetical protein